MKGITITNITEAGVSMRAMVGSYFIVKAKYDQAKQILRYGVFPKIGGICGCGYYASHRGLIHREMECSSLEHAIRSLSERLEASSVQTSMNGAQFLLTWNGVDGAIKIARQYNYREMVIEVNYKDHQLYFNSDGTLISDILSQKQQDLNCLALSGKDESGNAVVLLMEPTDYDTRLARLKKETTNLVIIE